MTRDEQGKQQYIMHKQSTLHQGAEKVMDEIKRKKAQKVRLEVSERLFPFRHDRRGADT